MWTQTAHNLYLHSLDAGQGLAQSYNWYVYHDSEGFVWISSYSGLNRFDGLHVRQYHAVRGDSTALLEENIYSEFMEDAASDLWFSTPSTVHRYDRAHDRFQRYFPKDQYGKALDRDLKVFFLERDTFLWFVNGQTGIYRFNIRSPDQPADLVATTDQWICRAATDASGRVVRLFAYGMAPGLDVYSIRNGQLQSSDQPVFFANFFLEEVYPETEDLIWVTASPFGLISWDGQSGMNRIGGFEGMSCTVEPWGRDSLIVLARDVGLFVLHKKNPIAKPLVHWAIGSQAKVVDNARDIYLDEEENLWISDYSNGLHFGSLRKGKFRSLPKTAPPGSTNLNYFYWALEEVGEDQIWAGTNTEGILVLDTMGRLIDHYRHDPGDPFSLPYDMVTDILEDRKGVLWVATSMGLARHDGNGRFILVPDVHGRTDRHVVHLSQTSTGAILITSERGGLFELRQENGRYYYANLLPQDTSYTYQTVFENRSGQLICNRDSREIVMFQYSPGQLTRIRSLPSGGEVFGFHEGSDGRIYLGTSEGLLILKGDSMRIRTVRDGLPGNTITGLLADQAGNLWLSTSRGLSYYVEEADVFRNFSRGDGALSLEYHHYAAMRRSNGELWFGGADGITAIPPREKIPELSLSPKVALIRILVNDEEPERLFCEVTGASAPNQIRHLKLKWKQRTVTLQFASLEYSDPSSTQLEYFLRHHDREGAWVRVERGQAGWVRYSNLLPGHYTLVVRARNSDGLPADPAPIELIHLTISPPFFLRWQFFAFLGISFAAGIYALYRNRVERIRKREALRRREAEIKAQLAETETAILRLQMNPHFIFNSMNSINAVILEKDANTASDYLGRFAALMRKILELAAKPYISVSEEIDLLEQYLKVETMRLETRFTYQFDVDPRLDPDEILVPTMILQPFVENAIWHGLSARKVTGNVRIGFHLEENSLLCTVEDDGVGRKAAAEKKDTETGHRSKALSITRHRLELLEAREGAPTSLEIIDLIDHGGQPAGTKVLLRLPLL